MIVDFIFDVASPNTYLAHKIIPSMEERTGAIFNYIPIFFITIYRFLFARFFYGNCRFIPSCSEYAMEAFRKFSFFKAFKMSFSRILRCHPYGSFGYDPINNKEDFSIKKVS